MTVDLNNIELIAKITEFEIERMNAIKQGGRVNDYLVSMLTHDLEVLHKEAKRRGIEEARAKEGE